LTLFADILSHFGIWTGKVQIGMDSILIRVPLVFHMHI